MIFISMGFFSACALGLNRELLFFLASPSENVFIWHSRGAREDFFKNISFSTYIIICFYEMPSELNF